MSVMKEEERGGVGGDSSVRRGIMHGDGGNVFVQILHRLFLKMLAEGAITPETCNFFQDPH